MPVVSSGCVLVEDSLLDSVSLSECVINISQFEAAWHLVVGVQRVSLPDGDWGLLKGVWLTADDVGGDVCLLHVFSLSSVEAANALG